MTMRRLLLTVAVLAGCQKASQETPPSTQNAQAPGVAFAAPPPPAPPPTTTAPPAPTPTPTATATTVELTSVTLADDCGGRPPHTPPAAQRKMQPRADQARGARARQICEQTSMQLAVTASSKTTMKIKSVELFDERGTSLGTLAASKPTRWSATSSAYEAWDETVPASLLVNVSYVLQQPNWARIGDRWNRTFTLQTVVTIDGVDSAANKTVTLSAPASLPPNVRT